MASRRSLPFAEPRPRTVDRVLRLLARKVEGLELPAVEKISESQKQDAFQILISTLLSARTQDATTLAASTRLFSRARTPRAVLRLPVKKVETLIYPVSFYQNKAVFVREASRRLLEAYGGRVPATSSSSPAFVQAQA